jgi:hypothetical protein
VTKIWPGDPGFDSRQQQEAFFFPQNAQIGSKKLDVSHSVDIPSSFARGKAAGSEVNH